MTPAEICIPAIIAFVLILAYIIYCLETDLEKSYDLPGREANLNARHRALSTPRSPTELFLEGGGDLSNPRVVALLAEAERGWNRHHAEHSQDRHRAHEPVHDAAPLHAHQVTADDAAMIRMMAGAHFGPDATVTLPSGRTVTGTEMQQWIETNEN